LGNILLSILPVNSQFPIQIGNELIISINNLIEAVDYVTDIKKQENTLLNRVLLPKRCQVIGRIAIPRQNGL
jgi:hypothetical protein